MNNSPVFVVSTPEAFYKLTLVQGIDPRTGRPEPDAMQHFLAAHPELQRSATIMVHSFNAEGALRMVEELRRSGRHADYVPFHFLEDRLKKL